MLALGGAGHQGAILAAIKKGLKDFDRLAIAVSYVQLSGWELLRPLLANKAAHVRLLCTDQFGITDPAAIRAIQQAGVDVRAYIGGGVYHPKIYIVSRGGGADRWILGSANLSRSALMTGVEAAVTGDDADGIARGWFDKMFADAAQSSPYDEARLSALEAAFAARLKARLTFERASPPQPAQAPDVNAAGALESAFATLPGSIITLNADQAANNVRTLRRIKQILDGNVALEGKALSEMKLIGLARDGGFTALGQAAQGKDGPGIAAIWMAWLKSASVAELILANASGKLMRVRQVFDTFWNLPKPVRDHYLAYCTEPTPDDRPTLQTVELLANTGRRFPHLTVADVETLSSILTARSHLAPALRIAISDYLDNKGTRGWAEPDRALILQAWHDAP